MLTNTLKPAVSRPNATKPVTKKHAKAPDAIPATARHHPRQNGQRKKDRLCLFTDRGGLLLIRASCRIRTNDPEITNHVLWPTELKRRVGKLTISRRYDLLPLLRSSPGGFKGSWPYGTCPYVKIRFDRAC